MLKKITWFFIGLSIVAWNSFFTIQIYKHYAPKSTSILTITTSFPAKGTILRYEDFRGYKVPIKSDGQGGSYKWIADVPWSAFSIEEKFDMAKVHGGYLSDSDIQEIKQKYGVR